MTTKKGRVGKVGPFQYREGDVYPDTGTRVYGLHTDDKAWVEGEPEQDNEVVRYQDLKSPSLNRAVRYVSVSNIADPSAELGALIGEFEGQLLIAYMAQAGTNYFTIYAWDSAKTAGEDTPYYIEDSAGTGAWVAIGGRYINTDLQINQGLIVGGDLTVNGSFDASSFFRRVAVADIDAPTELGDEAGDYVGQLLLAYQVDANANPATIYIFDTANAAGSDSPFAVGASGGGFWIAVAGAYVNASTEIKAQLTVPTVNATTISADAQLNLQAADAQAVVINPAALNVSWAVHAEGKSEVIRTDGQTGAVYVKTDNPAIEARVGGILSVNTTNAGNIGSGVDDLMTYAVAAGAFANNGDTIRLTAYGTTAANANTKKLYLSGLSSPTDVLVADLGNGKDWHVDVMLVRNGDASTKIFARLSYMDIGGGSEVVVIYRATGTALDWTAGGTIGFQGEATSNNDIVQNFMSVEWLPTAA